ncbi:MAG: hypothetical protein KY476_18840 [Planctomycetes bacterium]|nr:hypothetical protein [Planctomycetota bacterium]
MTASNSQFRDEWLSAYYDGESTPAERAEVERRLTADESARHDLEADARLSALLAELPRERLSADFSRAVLSRIERELLLAPASDDGPRPRRKRRIAAGLIALSTAMATAAAIVVLVNVLGVDPAAPDASGVAKVDPRNEGDGLADTRDTLRQRGLRSPDALMRGDEKAGGQKALPDAQAATGVAETVPADQDDTYEARSRANAIAEREAREAMEAGTKAELAESLDELSLQHARVGDVVRYARPSADGVAVVELTVVDVEDAVGALRVLLVPMTEADDRSPPLASSQPAAEGVADAKDRSAGAAAPPREEARLRAIDPASNAAPNGLVAVYVESSGEQLASALLELKRRGILERPTLQPRVEPDQVEVAWLDSPEDEVLRRKQRRPLSLAAAVALAREADPSGAAAPTARDRIEPSPPAQLEQAPTPAARGSASAGGEASTPSRARRGPERAESGSRGRFTDPDAPSEGTIAKRQRPAGGRSLQLLFNARPESLRLDRAAAAAPAPAPQGADAAAKALEPRELAPSDSRPAEAVLADNAVRVIFVFKVDPPTAAGPEQ